jgi:2,4-didehydro-3-deoxy-L-rhamnonate hydrolase
MSLGVRCQREAHRVPSNHLDSPWRVTWILGRHQVDALYLPTLVTPDEIDDVLNLHMWLDVSGVRRKHGSTSTMIFDPYFIVHYLSQLLVLEPGDLINTGTPPGVGMGLRPQVWLQAGDVIELGIEDLGQHRQTVIAAR